MWDETPLTNADMMSMEDSVDGHSGLDEHEDVWSLSPMLWQVRHVSTVDRTTMTADMKPPMSKMMTMTIVHSSNGSDDR
jgi:hypothetical protein